MRKVLLMFVGLLLLAVGPAWGTTFDFSKLVEGETGINGTSSQGIDFSTQIEGHVTADGNENFTNPLSPYITLTDPHFTGMYMLNINFLKPTSSLSFAAALNYTGGPLADGFYVILSNSSDPIFVGTAPASSGKWNEGVFNYSGAAITSAQISFSSAGDQFVVGNLTYEGSPVPLPPAVVLLGSGLLGLVGLARRKRS